jgi:hypothetical protein
VGGDGAHRALPELVPDNFTGNASYRRDNLAPLKILPTKTASINLSELEDAAVHTLTLPDPQAFFENRIPGFGCIAKSSEARVTWDKINGTN